LTSSSSAYRADIDGLRALAILPVVGFHAFPDSITGGFVGVDVFFVISGFLITSIIIDALARGRFSYLDFYVRRIRRIFPALILVLIPSFAFGWYILLPHEFAQLERHLTAAAAFASNFSLWAEAGYFDNSANTKPLQHLWSLAIEEQFYILWPLLLGFAWKRTKKLAVLTAVVAIVSFSINLWLVSGDKTAAFYSPLSRTWELMVGGLLAQLAHEQGGRASIRPNWQSTIGLGLILSAVILLDSNRAFPGWWALLPTVGTFLVIGAGPGAWLNSKFLARREMVLVGLISYPLYLWHWPVLVFMRIALQRNLVVVDKLIAVSLSLCLAYATYRIVEKPLRNISPAWSARTLSASMASILLLAAACSHWQLRPRNDTEAISKFLDAVYDWDYPDGLEHRIVAGSLRRAYAYKGALSTNTLFFGDSNMEQYYPRIRHLIEQQPDKFNSAILVGNQRQRCYAVVHIFLKEADDCGSVMRDISSLALAKGTDAIAIIYGGMSYELLMRTEAGYFSFGQFIRSMKLNGRRVYVVLSMPDGEELDPRNMFSGSRLTKLEAKPVSDIHFNYQEYFRRYGESRDKVERAALDNGAVVIDPLKFLCPEKSCPVFDGKGTPLYKDWVHMRASYVRESAVYIDQTLEPSRPVDGAIPGPARCRLGDCGK
jgi:peptidoglycan/LPS O-acetylase OafA/YrhL